MHRVGSS